LKKKAQKSWPELTSDPEDDHKGVAFYHFPQVPDPNNFKRMYRARLNIIGGDDPALAEEIVAESNRVYDLNTAVFTDMDARAKEINGFDNVRPDQVRERVELETAYGEEPQPELKQRKNICPVMSGKIPLEATKDMANPHVETSAASCPFQAASTQFMSGLRSLAEPVIVMALASLMTLVLHVSDVI